LYHAVAIASPVAAYLVAMGKLRDHIRRSRFQSATSGVAAVEFALLCPLYIFLVTGMTAYGVYYGAAHSIQQCPRMR
jgi:Flp pilus assembly protein TadG